MYGMLIADDERAVRQGLVKNIRWAKYGFEVLGEAENGAQALLMLKSLRPQLLITDIRMPDLSGLEVMIRARAALPDLQVIILSAYDSFEYAQQAMLHSAAGYLLKPIDPAQLDVLMDKVVARLKSGAVGSSPADQPDGVVERARKYVADNYMQRLTLEQTAAACYVNASYLSSAFKSALGVSFTDYLTEARMRKARALLETSEYRVNEIAARVGYDDYTYFCRVFKKSAGVAPLRYRMGERAEDK